MPPLTLDKFVRQLANAVPIDEPIKGIIPQIQVGEWNFEIDHVSPATQPPTIVASVSDELQELSALWIQFMTDIGAGQIIREGKPSLWNFMQYLQDNLTIETVDEAKVFIDTVQSGGEGRQVRRAHYVLQGITPECTGANDGTCPKHPEVTIDKKD